MFGSMRPRLLIGMRMNKPLSDKQLAAIDRMQAGRDAANAKPERKRKRILDELKKLQVEESRLLAKMVAYKTGNRIEFFTRPNPVQEKLLKAWDDDVLKVFTFTGANRIGKCHTIRTPIDTIKGPVLLGDLYADRKPFQVWSWDGKRKVKAQASPPFKKARTHRCYQLEMSNGVILEPADEHRVLTSLGWISVEQLQASFGSLRESTLAPGLLDLPQDALRSSETALNYQGRCSGAVRLCDERLLFWLGICRAFFPLQDDAQLPGAVLSRLGDPGGKHTSILQLIFDRLSILDAPRRSLDQVAEFLSRIVYKILLPFLQESLLFETPVGGLACDPRSVPLGVLHQSRVSYSYDTPFNIIGENRINSITPIASRQEVYDFEVPGYKNYFAGGIVHHNTTIGTVLAISTLMGHYPWDNKPLIFPHRKARKVRYVGQDWEKQIKAVIIPELEKWWPQARKVKKKKNNNGVDSLWTDLATGSTLEIMSNLQDSELHEGWSGDLVIYDEPPKRDIRVANARGLIDRKGRELFCMTLLKEAWVDREIIKAVDETGRPDMTVFNVHGDIKVNVGFGITQEGVDQFAKTLTDEEKDARLRGIPSYMSGLVYPQYDRRVHLIERFQVPLDWVVDIAIDIHPREKQAVLFCAVAPDGMKYLVNEIWAHGDGTWVGEEVVRCIKTCTYRVGRIIIDPLSKGDKNNPNTVFEKVQNVLWSNQYHLETATKDKTSGILLIRNHLYGPNKQPSLYIFNDMIRTIFEIEGYMYDKETQNPQDKDDHMMENLYRLMLLGTIWALPEDEDGMETGIQQGRSKVGGY